MNYIEIILRGYCNENDRKFLDKYFIREFRNAEKEYYDLTVFFGGLKTGYETLKNECQKQFFKYKYDLLLMKADAHNENKTIEDKKTIEYCENELSLINLENYTIYLPYLTNNIFKGHLSYNEVEFINKKINKAKKVLVRNEASNINNK